MNQLDPTMPNHDELIKAEQLEAYLSSLEQGRLVPAVLDNVMAAQDKNFLQFARRFKVAAKPQEISAMEEPLLVTGYNAPRPRRPWWYWLMPLPIVGVAMFGLWVWFKPVGQTTTSLAVAAVTAELAAVEQLDSDLAVMTADLDRSLREIDVLTTEDLSAL